MKLILVTGLRETEKDSIVEMALNKSSTTRKRFKYVNFEKSDTVSSGITNLNHLKDFHLTLHDEIEQAITGSRREGLNVIVNGNFTIKTDLGYVPLLIDGFFRGFKPDIIVILENRLNELVDNPRKALEIKEQQEIDRGYASRYAAMLGIPLKIIKVSKQNISHSIKEFSETLKYMIGD